MKRTDEETRTILLLGGSIQQLVAIDTANKLGYRTVLCDYLTDNPGQHRADVFHLVSTTDKEAVLDVARSEKVDGVVAYASDPAAPTAAYVADAMDLPGLSHEAALNFCDKARFRDFLSENGFCVPGSIEINADEPFEATLVSGLGYPLVVKPTDSSGSKGVTVVRDLSALKDAIEYARSYSRNRKLIVEEFIERAHEHVIEGELLVHDGEVAVWGLINSIRDCQSNPLLPAAYSYPLELNSSQVRLVKEQVSRLVRVSGMRDGAFNIEMIISGDGRLFFLDAGPRNGGNMLPDFIAGIACADIVEATLKMAMGEKPDASVALDGVNGAPSGLVVFHSSKEGTFSRIEYSDIAASRIVKEYLFKHPGDEVEPFSTCDKAFGFAFLRFESEAEKSAVMNDLDSHVRVALNRGDE